ncbi:CRISPR-associated helicase Cas3' [Clostridium botulinum]|uniref:CRISPR-associated helicase Cas3' n=1 Tax=Clostridium botulinum TaxID=1491 RepID=UPI00178CD2A3|nr:CRISPR-associated helicase Cas3' [Clostridium botulinum]
MNEVIAKKTKNGVTQTLEDHTFMVIEEALSLIDDKELEVISKETGYGKDKIKDLIFFCTYFHDIGKATYEFQDTIKNESKSYHSLYSSSLFLNLTDFEVDEDYGINMLILCILTHHSVFNVKSSFKTVGNNKMLNFKFLPCAEIFFYNYKEAYEKYLNKACNYEFQYEKMDLNELDEEIEELYDDIDNLRKYEGCSKIRLLYSYVLGILNLADWIASAKFNNSLPKIKFDYLIDKKKLCRRFAESIRINEFIPKDFQEKLSNCKGSVLVEIPTGEGKTEGAFLWAINNIDNELSKIIYTLPTQTTSNKLYERAKNIFWDDTGLIHSSSKIYLEKKYEQENGKVDDKFHSDILFSATFNKGATVSTIDSLLKYFLNIGRYNIAMLNFLRAVVIIDEVHSYDFKLMGFIKRFLEICEYYNVPVCLMSASIPNKIKELLNIEKLPIITDEKLFEKKANYIYKVDDSLDNRIDDVIVKFNEGKNILIVRNKINKSIEIYKELKKKGIENIILYNSQFKKKDRIRKENEIYEKLKNEEHFILVATQVVEISLDIDFDVMFTDNAPIDSLIQRFGRVNRKKKQDKIGEIYIFRDTDIKPYYLRMLEITYKTLEEGLFPLKKYTEWLNKVYDKLFNDKKVINELESKFADGYKKFNKRLSELHGIYQSKDIYNLRDIGLSKKDYILYEDYDKNIYDNTIYDNTISLPVYLENEHLLLEKDYKKEIYYDVLNLDYNYEIGAIIEDSEDDIFFD